MSRSEDSKSPLDVVIVDPHEVSRAALGALLRTEGLTVVADVSEVRQALAVPLAAHPDVVILDIGSGGPAVATDARAIAQLPSLPTVVLTSSAAVAAPPDGFAFVAKPDLCARALRLAMRVEVAADTTGTADLGGAVSGNRKEKAMSFDGYLRTIREKTGKPPEQLVALARAKGLAGPDVKAGAVIEWLKREYGLGRGHAMAIVALIKQDTAPRHSTDEKIARHFSGKRARWRTPYDTLVEAASSFGGDTDVDPGASYLSLRKSGKKFAIVKVTAERLDVGLKLADGAGAKRLEPAGSWNTMVTHRVRVQDPSEVDRELIDWLQKAYTAA